MDNNACVMCGEEEETYNHVFLKCKVAWRVWYMCNAWIGMSTTFHWDARVNFESFKLGWATPKINRM